MFGFFRFADALPGRRRSKQETGGVSVGHRGRKYLLQYKFQPGEEIRASVAHEATIETSIGGTTQTTDMKSLSTKLWRVTAVDGSGAMTIENLVENVEMSNKMSGRQEVHYNSQTDKAAPLGYEDIAKSIGKVLSTVTIDSAGNVLKRDDQQTPGRRERRQQPASCLRCPRRRSPSGMSGPCRWSMSVALDDGTAKALDARQRYELEQVEDNLATIAVETQVLTPVNNPKLKRPAHSKADKGTLRFDLSAGRIVAQRTDLNERVLAFAGGDSAMHYVAHFTEKLLPPGTKTAAVESPAAQPDKK